MAVKKKSITASQRQSGRRSSGRKSQGRFTRFIRAVSVSAIVSFLGASLALDPQWLDTLGLRHLDLGSFSPMGQKLEPVPLVRDGMAQTAFSACPHFFPGQAPMVPARSGLRELCFSSFAILHSGQTKTPVFVAQRLNRQTLAAARAIKRTDRFYAESRLPQVERAELADYRGSGYSRGHMAPAGDMGSDEAMAQSFSLANMVPQDQQHNAGAWNQIEQDTRKYVMRARGDVYVFTGPVFLTGASTIGQGKVAVPTHVYKLVFDADTGRAWVHWQANQANARPDRPISYDVFVARTGLHLLPGLAN